MSCCKECPYKVDNNHNRKLREFTERTGKKHTCHMVNPKLWDTSNEKEICKNFDINQDNLIFDDTKPKGQHKKPAVSNSPSDFKFTELSEGIKESVNWFLNNYPNIRK